jgi:L-cysteine S-thiosulfotransferase
MDLRQPCFMLAAALAAAVLGVHPASAAPSEAQKLAAQHCEQCHEIKGVSDFGNVGPSLVDLKARYPDRKEVAAIIADESKRNPQTVMPPFGRNLILSDKQIALIVDYLYNQ